MVICRNCSHCKNKCYITSTDAGHGLFLQYPHMQPSYPYEPEKSLDTCYIALLKWDMNIFVRNGAQIKLKLY